MDIDDDDPCRAKKRTFFSSSGPARPTLPKSLVNGHANSSSNGFGRLNGNGVGNGFKSNIIGIGGITEWDVSSNGPSRAVSPASPS